MYLPTDGAKKLKVFGKWNSHCDSVACSADGEALSGATPTRLWTCNAKPSGHYYGFTKFAERLNSGAGIKTPLASDSRWVLFQDRGGLQRLGFALENLLPLTSGTHVEPVCSLPHPVALLVCA